MTQSMLTNDILTFSITDFEEFLKSEGITVNTKNKARGNLGFYMKNRIDISKNLNANEKLYVMAHEYAHKINHDLDHENFNKGSSLEKIFRLENVDFIINELILVTAFVDKHSNISTYEAKKTSIKQEMKILEDKIKYKYPDFKRSYLFKPVNLYFRKNNSPAKYLLKYDSVSINDSFLFMKKNKIYSVSDIDKDFPTVPEEFRTYIKLKSIERKYKRLCQYVNKSKKYYNKPTELFARFVQGLFLDKNKVQKLAPETYSRFFYLLEKGYYGRLKELMKLTALD